LRDDFNIPGLRVADLPRIKRKSVMKRYFRAAGLAVPRARVCRTPAAARAFVRSVGGPVVAKPDVGVGAARTYRIDGPGDLAAFLADKPPIDYILEEFVEGEIVTYDGLIDRAGEVVFASTMTYSTGVLDSVAGSDIWYWIPRRIPADLDAAGRALVRALGIVERPFHFEFFRRPDGSLVGLELNIRPPGGLTVDMFNYSNDFDFYRLWAEVLLTGRAEARPSRAYVCAYVGRKAGVAYALSDEQVLTRFRNLIVHHERIADVFAAAIGNRGFILRHPELEPIAAAARAIHERVG
ncbi:MAG TPA: ATP-grasp domain-containing protein, partial [Candidatus Limnocylindrales bacterium]|nr:ATP-grasp domain-containing protein [Candidatus Limnocylindrales bacterium]